MKVFAQTQFEALHRWKDAPDQTFYLREPHRHMFHVRFEVEVTHDDRDIEFINMKHEIQNAIVGIKVCEPEEEVLNYSCETYASKIIEIMSSIYGDRKMRCEVSEDGENGAIVENY